MFGAAAGGDAGANARWGIFTDIHFQSRNLNRIQRAGDWIIDAFKANGVSRVICLGDVFHDRQNIAVDVLSASGKFIDRMMRELDVPIHFLVGNHDLHLRGSSDISTLDLLDIQFMKERCSVYREPQKIEIDGFKCLIVPWFDNIKDVREIIQAMDRKERRETILFGHFSVCGAYMSSWKSPAFEDPSSTLAFHSSELQNFKAVILGHFHYPQFVSENSIYVGAPLQHNWGDLHSSKRGIIICEPQKWIPPAAFGRVHLDLSQHRALTSCNGLKFVKNPCGDMYLNFDIEDIYYNNSFHLEADVQGKNIRVTHSNNFRFLIPELKAMLLEKGAESLQFRCRDPRENLQSLLESSVSLDVLKDAKDPFHQKFTFADLLIRYVEEIYNEASCNDSFNELKKEEIAAFGKELLHEIGLLQTDDKEQVTFDAELASLEIENFFSVRQKTTIPFSEMTSGVWFIRGPNGAGKSLLFEAITWCLFGDTIRSDMSKYDIVNENASVDDVCRVWLQFSNGYAFERIRKSRGGTSVVNLYQDGNIVEEFSKRDYRSCQRRIQELIGCDMSKFLKTVVFGNQRANFVSERPAKRREILENICNLTLFDDCFDHLRTEIQEIESRLQVMHSKIHASTEHLNESKKRKSSLEELNALIEKRLAEIDTSFEDAENMLEKSRNDFQQMKELSNDSLISELKSKHSSLLSQKRHSLSAIDSLEKLRNSRLQQLSNMKLKLESVQEKQTCPTCASVINSDVQSKLKLEFANQISQVEKSISDHEIELSERRNVINSISESIKNLEDQIRNAPKVDFSAELRRLESSAMNHASLVTERKEKLLRSVEHAKEIGALSELIASLEMNLETFRAESASLSQKLPVRQFWLSAFAKTTSSKSFVQTFRNFCIDDIVNHVNEYLASYMSVLQPSSPEDSVDLSLTLSPSMNFNAEFGRRSSGQRQRNVLAVMFALHQVSKELTGFRPSFLLLDEVFDSLDAQGQDQVVQLFPLLGVHHILVISHSMLVDSESSHEFSVQTIRAELDSRAGTRFFHPILDAQTLDAKEY